MKVGRSATLLDLILIILLKSDSHDYVELYAEAFFNESPAWLECFPLGSTPKVKQTTRPGVNACVSSNLLSREWNAK